MELLDTKATPFINLNIKQLKRKALSKSGNFQDFKFMENSRPKNKIKSFINRKSSSNSVINSSPLEKSSMKEPKN